MDPSLKVDMKMTSYGSRAEMERVKRRIAAGEYWRKKEIQDSYKSVFSDNTVPLVSYIVCCNEIHFFSI